MVYRGEVEVAVVVAVVRVGGGVEPDPLHGVRLHAPLQRTGADALDPLPHLVRPDHANQLAALGHISEAAAGCEAGRQQHESTLARQHVWCVEQSLDGPGHLLTREQPPPLPV